MILLVEEVGKSYKREPQGEGESPSSCILPVFYEHLLCASSTSPVSHLAFPHQPGSFWVCFHKTPSPLPHRLGLGHLQGLSRGSAYSAMTGCCSHLSSGQGGLGMSAMCHLVLDLLAALN